MRKSNFPLMKRTSCFALCFLMWLTGVTSSNAQDGFFLPVEIGQGIIFTEGVDPYTLSVQLHPSLGFGGEPKKLMIGGSVAEVYTNPKWATMWGGRLAFHVTKLRKKPITVGPNITYGTLQFVLTGLMESSEFRRLSAGLNIDIWEGSLGISPRVGYDFKPEKIFLEVALGMNLK